MESLEDAVEVEKINKINKADFLSDVPANLRFKVTENIYDGVANKVLIFKDRDPDLVSNMIPKMTPMKVKKDEFVYKKGQFSSAIYLLFNGRVVEMDGDINFREYSVGSYFGEVEILKNSPRKYNVKTLEDCQLMAIERNDLLNTLRFYPELKIDLISCAIVKEMKAKQTIHKIRDLRSLIRVDQFWLAEDVEFNKSVSEKIQGLYFFHKKKYESYLKQKQIKKGWFRDKWDKGAPLLPSNTDSILDQEAEKKTRAIKAEAQKETSTPPKTRNSFLDPTTSEVRKDKLSVFAPQGDRTPARQGAKQPDSAGKPQKTTADSKSLQPPAGANQNYDELNRKMITDLGDKVDIVRKNLNQNQSESKRIGEKIAEVDYLLQKLLERRQYQRPSTSQDNDAPKVLKKMEEESSSIDFSGDMPSPGGNRKKKSSQNKDEDGDSIFDCFDAGSVVNKSERTVKNSKKQIIGNMIDNLIQLHRPDNQASSSLRVPKGLHSPGVHSQKNGSDYEILDTFGGAGPRPKSSAAGHEGNSGKLEMIKEADENQEHMSTVFGIKDRGGSNKKIKTSTISASKDKMARPGYSSSQPVKQKTLEKRPLLSEELDLARQNNYITRSNLRVDQQGSNRQVDYPTTEMQTLLREINQQVVSINASQDLGKRRGSPPKKNH